MKRIEVAVGIVFDDQCRVLVGQRIVKDQYYLKWEFPGGKLEQGETVTAALAREFREEVGIRIHDSEPLMQLEHDYPDRHVRLYIHAIKSFQGDVQPMEGQAIKWVAVAELDALDFLQGNKAIIEVLKSIT